MQKGDRQHAPVEDERGSLSVEYEVLHIFYRDADFFRVGLVVIGNVKFANGGTFFVKIVATGRETKDDDVVGRTFRPDGGERFLQQGGTIGSVVGD